MFNLSLLSKLVGMTLANIASMAQPLPGICVPVDQTRQPILSVAPLWQTLGVCTKGRLGLKCLTLKNTKVFKPSSVFKTFTFLCNLPMCYSVKLHQAGKLARHKQSSLFGKFHTKLNVMNMAPRHQLLKKKYLQNVQIHLHITYN